MNIVRQAQVLAKRVRARHRNLEQAAVACELSVRQFSVLLHGRGKRPHAATIAALAKEAER
jgi:hypothetical protein